MLQRTGIFFSKINKQILTSQWLKDEEKKTEISLINSSINGWVDE